ncbi:MAG TPA: TVP38/TMEM64 family protein [Erysipelothrix sp.]|nr:TVP38/TMEM64 family protein [Erysipelothrix sp.]
MTEKQKNQLFNIAGLVGIILTLIVGWWAYQEGLLTSQEKMEAFIKPWGWMGIGFFILAQIIQTVIPIIPGAITSIAGMAMYGIYWGTLYNWIGIVLGCAILFLIVRRYGEGFVKVVVHPKTYDRYIGWLDKGDGFERFFIITMILPFMPADFICALAALTKMKFNKYMIIIVLTKPISILTYTLGASKIIEFFYNVIVV